MHTCAPPKKILKKIVKEYPTTVGSYGHLLLEWHGNADVEKLALALKPYFESAHLDARDYFNGVTGIDLHPDADGDEPSALYPNCLPTTARRGLFGEVLAGLLTESLDYVGGHEWVIPIYLFRYHADVEKYLYDLERDPSQAREVFGRFGTDFLALCMDDEGCVTRFIAGEAKWRASLTDAVVAELLHGRYLKTRAPDGSRVRSGKGIWHSVNNDTPVPHGVRQLQRLLKECDPDGHAAAILSLDRALLARNATPLPRTDLILISGNGSQGREEGDCHLIWDACPQEYTAGNDLQVVEAIFSNGEALIDAIYDNLWSEEDVDAGV